MNIADIISEYNDNIDFYIDLTNNIKSSSDDRFCHHKVICLHIIQKFIPINTYLELGVHNGASMSYVVNFDTKKHCFGIDLFNENYIKNYDKDRLSLNRSLNNIQKNNKNSEIVLIKGNTNSDSTLQQFIESYKDKLKKTDIGIDLLFIDADHNYKPLLNDLNTYTKYLKRNGILVVDDFPTGGNGGTKKALDEFLRNNDFRIIGELSLIHI